ncbi:VOC family protein [Mumia sp. DW29H23]|uniref:VOC family protein n=1 Tax=Mumia sp. DW29H23 TaxID=3421241 RepID=UPI003D690E89
MRRNRSIPAATVVPVLVYPDVRAAVAWLASAFGFVEHVRIGEDHRAQLGVGDGAVIVADVRHDQRPPRGGEVTHLVMVRVDGIDEHCEHARSCGAPIVMEPTTFEYGERQYVAEDLAGHRWTFTETLEDVPPEAWGGTTVRPR